MRHYGYELENEIFWSGLTNGWEKQSTKIWIQLCKDADTIFDIGANTGIYSLIAKTVNPKSKVFAFEPVSRVFSKLEENIALNNFDINAAEDVVSNADGNAIIYDTTAEHTFSITVNKELTLPGANVIETTISTVTIDSVVKKYNLKSLDLLKIDVETHEPEVLEGFSEYISQFKPTILEILNDEVGKKVNDLVNGLDYLYFNIDENAGIRKVDNITKSDYYNYFLNKVLLKNLN